MYEVERCESPPDGDLVCAVCHCLLHSPLTISCQHTFCDTCINTWIKQVQDGEEEEEGQEERTESSSCPCPVCRQRFDPVTELTEAKPDLLQRLNQLRITCANQSNGCDVILASKDIEAHEASCAYQTVCCRYIVCGKSVLKKDREAHETDCPLRTVKCTGECQLEIPYRDIGTHNCLESLRNIIDGHRMSMRFLEGIYSAIFRRLGKHCGCLEWASKQMTDYMGVMHNDVEALAQVYRPESKDMLWKILENIQKGMEVEIPKHEDVLAQLQEQRRREQAEETGEEREGEEGGREGEEGGRGEEEEQGGRERDEEGGREGVEEGRGAEMGEERGGEMGGQEEEGGTGQGGGRQEGRKGEEEAIEDDSEAGGERGKRMKRE